MHAARIDRSPRLPRVHALLSDGIERSTHEIITRANVRAVNNCVAELKANAFQIERWRDRDPVYGNPIWKYRMPSPTRSE